MDHGQYAGERQRKAEPEMGVVQDLGGQLGRQSGEVRPSGLFVDDEVDQGRGRRRGNQVTKQGCPAQKGPERQTDAKPIISCSCGNMFWPPNWVSPYGSTSRVPRGIRRLAAMFRCYRVILAGC